jgi:putative Holliday junction resolvase
MILLAVDHGTKRIGLAVSDDREIVAAPLKAIKVNDEDDAVRQVSRIYAEVNAEKILLGIPLDAKGETGKQGALVREFGEKLRGKLNTEVIYWDEYLSSKTAERKLGGSRSKSGIKKKSEKIDSEVARMILQEYLNRPRGQFA